MSWTVIIGLGIVQALMSTVIYCVLSKVERETLGDHLFFWAVVLLPWAFMLFAVAELAYYEMRPTYRALLRELRRRMR